MCCAKFTPARPRILWHGSGNARARWAWLGHTETANLLLINDLQRIKHARGHDKAVDNSLIINALERFTRLCVYDRFLRPLNVCLKRARARTHASRPLYKIYTHVVKSYTPRPISHLNQLYRIYTHCIKNDHIDGQKKVGTAPAIMVGSSLKRRPQPTISNIFIHWLFHAWAGYIGAQIFLQN